MYNNRRQTLATDNTAIPAPSTAARHRPSMAPGGASKHARPSVAPGSSQPGSSQQSSSQGQSQGHYNAPATVARSGNMYGSGNVALGWSAARGDAGNLRSSYAPPVTSVRRSSVYAGNASQAGRRQSAFPGQNMPLAAPTPGHQQMYALSNRSIKDPRPVKDRTFQKKAREEIMAFLESRGYPHALSEKTLATPTTRDFQEIFKFIYHCFDGRPVSSLTSLQKKFEDEVPVLLRSAGYPYVSDISKSHLQAIGAQHSWPGMLAMLHWFVQTIINRQQAFLDYVDVHIDITQLDTPQAVDRMQHRTEMWVEFLSTAYPEFLAHEDYDIENQKRRLDDRYEAAGEQTKAVLMRTTEEIERLKAEYESLNKESHHLDKHRHEQKKLDSDIVHMESYLGRLEAGVKKSAGRCEEQRKRILDLEQQEKCALTEREKCAKIVQQQNLSEVDIHRLTTDRQTLDGKLRIARQEREERSRRCYDLEIKRTQAYNAIERLVEEYEAKGTKLGLMPSPPAGYEHISFHQELTGSAATAAAMVPDCTTIIKPAITRLRMDTTAGRREEEDKVLSVEDALTDLRERTQSKLVECEEVEVRYSTLQAELLTAKESLNNEMVANYAELDRLQQQCNSLRTEMSGGLLAIDQRLQSLRNEYDKHVADIEKLRRDNSDAFAHELEMIIAYKTYMNQRVDDLYAEVA